jgi:hypothetical protein
MSSSVIDFSIVTVSRPVNYIETVAEHLPGNQLIRLFVGSLETRYLDNIRRRPLVRILLPTPEEWKNLEPLSVFQRATWNYWRALACIPNGAGRDGLLVFEDDILPASNWREHLEMAINAVSTEGISHFILALYSSRQHAATIQGKPFTNYPTHLFAGTQAIYYPESVRGTFAAFLYEHGVNMNEAPYDMLLAEFAARHSIPIFLTVPVLVQHIGRIGTGLGEFHQAPNFQFHLQPLSGSERS